MALSKLDNGLAIDAIEEIGDICFQKISWPRPVTGDRPGERRYPAQAVMCATSKNTSIAIAYETSMELIKNSSVNNMAYNAISKVCRPDLPDFRISHNKRDAASDFIVSVHKVMV